MSHSASQPPPVSKETLRTLKRLCRLRYPADKRAAKDLFTTMSTAFADMKRATQDALLQQMELSLPLLRKGGLIPEQAKAAATVATAAIMRLQPVSVDELVASITAAGQPKENAPSSQTVLTPSHSQIESSSVVPAMSGKTHTLS